jgi:hypothetical protein
VKPLRWCPEKSRWLKGIRGISFDELVLGRVVDIVDHPIRTNQRLMLFDYLGYIWVVPFVENEAEFFLKTLYPSRKYTQEFRRKGGFHEID